MFCTACPPDKEPCAQTGHFTGANAPEYSVSAQGFAKDNLQRINSGDLTTRNIIEGKHHELIHA